MIDYLGLILLAAWTLNAWAFLTVLSARPGFLRLALWAAVLTLPLLGWLAWFLLGPRPARA